MNKVILLVLFLISEFIFSQNFVLNPSFEEHRHCPESISRFSNNVSNWSIPTVGSTDYFNSCSKAFGFTNYNGVQSARTGKGYAGMYTYASQDYREYIQGEISETLIKGKTYEITFYINLADNSNHALRSFGILMTSKKLSNRLSDTPINPQHISDDVSSIQFIPLYSKDFYSDTNEWIEIKTTYTALGFENFFSIGNFKNNKTTDLLKLKKSKIEKFSYYYIDDVSIESVEKETQENSLIIVAHEEIPFKNDTIYTFHNVLFDFDKSELLDNSRMELDKLVNFLIQNKTLMLEIYGHTDAVGHSARNSELSNERAKSVRDYLVKSGISELRIKWFGFGSSKPVASNDSEEGREKNRRVEFKLFDN